MLVNCWGPDKHLILVLSHDNVVVWSLSRVRLFCDPVDCSPPGSSVHGISRQESWSGLPCPPPGDLPDPGIEPKSPALADDFFTV